MQLLHWQPAKSDRIFDFQNCESEEEDLAAKYNWFQTPNIVNGTQSNWISIKLNLWIKCDCIQQSNQIELAQKNWAIELNWTFDFWILDFYKTGVEINKAEGTSV